MGQNSESIAARTSCSLSLVNASRICLTDAPFPLLADCAPIPDRVSMQLIVCGSGACLYTKSVVHRQIYTVVPLYAVVCDSADCRRRVWRRTAQQYRKRRCPIARICTCNHFCGTMCMMYTKSMVYRRLHTVLCHCWPLSAIRSNVIDM